MSSLTTYVNCPTLQAKLEDVWCKSGSNEFLPLTEYTFSNENNVIGLEQFAIPSAGRIRTVQLTYSRRVLESEVDDYINWDTCTASSKRGETSATYTFDENAGVEIARKFDFIDLSRRCESDEMYFATLLNDLVDGAERKIETDIASKLVAGVGGFSTIDTDGVVGNVKTVATKLSDGTIDYDAQQMIMQSARFNQFCANPVVMGDYEIVNYYDAIGVGGVAQTGLDFQKVSPNQPLVLPSYRVGTAFSDTSKFLVYEPGAAVPVWYNMYAGDLGARLSTETHQFTTIVSRRGIPFDVSVIRDCNTVHVKLQLAWDLFFKPDDMYENSDILDGVTGILTFDVSNP